MLVLETMGTETVFDIGYNDSNYLGAAFKKSRPAQVITAQILVS